MELSDRIVLAVIYAMFCGGIVVTIRSIPSKIRLKRINELPDIKKKVYEAVKKFSGIGLLRTAQLDRMDRAIYEDLSYLHNLIVAHKGMINSDSVISSLAERDGMLKRTYIKMLSLMRTGRVSDAEQCMINETGTEMGKEFAALLISWEHIPPQQLKEVIVSHRISIKETCITRQKKREEMISDFIYFPATMNVFLIFINFIYISYFMQQKGLFEMIF